MHRGHQTLIARAREAAAARNVPLCVMTFEPYPNEFFQGSKACARIGLLRDKIEQLRRCGVDRVVIMPFNAQCAAQTPEYFIEQVIINSLQAVWVGVGDDFRYGAQRRGDFALLQSYGQRYAFEAVSIPAIHGSNEQRISSSAIRAALQAGQLDTARNLLGHACTLSGHVGHGKKLGRQLGFPTLNMRLASARHPSIQLALSGIFVVLVHGLDAESAEPKKGVASLGTRPTIAPSEPALLEVHVLDWEGDAYGKCIRVEFLKKLRDEKKYLSLDTLTKAIAQDIEDARQFFDLTPEGHTSSSAPSPSYR